MNHTSPFCDTQNMCQCKVCAKLHVGYETEDILIPSCKAWKLYCYLKTFIFDALIFPIGNMYLAVCVEFDSKTG